MDWCLEIIENRSTIRGNNKMVDIINNRIHNTAVEYRAAMFGLDVFTDLTSWPMKYTICPRSFYRLGLGCQSGVASNRIANNYIHWPLQTMVDCGGIYTLEASREPGHFRQFYYRQGQ